MAVHRETSFNNEIAEEGNRRLTRHIFGLINQGLGDKGSVIH